jgi:phosphoribosylglycinamide formyltransferase-1
LSANGNRLPVVVLISGSGSNLQAFIDACQDPDYPVTIKAVISNRGDAYGLQRAADAGIETIIVDHCNYDSRKAFDRVLMQIIDRFEPGLVILAGFMRILTDDLVNHYVGRMLNIHPSLLPDYTGLNTHQRVLDDRRKEHGASVHFVTAELDGGPVILQARVAVREEDSRESLATRVLEKEHIIYPLAVRWFAEGRLTMKNGKAMLDGKQLTEPCQLEDRQETTCDT